MAGADQSIVIRRIKKAAHAHHGGVWKLAYADFVTAMMAFFLLLWLLNAVTEEQLEGISNYFAPQNISPSQSGSGGMLGGTVLGDPGAMNAKGNPPSVVVELPSPKAGTGGEQFAGNKEAAPDKVSDEQAEEILRRKEEQAFQDAEEEIRKAIESIPSLKDLARSLLIDDTPEGLRIQIVDQEGKDMFPRGSAQMYLHTRRVLELLSKVIVKMPQRISISGHTDATKYASGDAGYTNWELSADRANACRRALVELGVPNDRLSVVVGRADTDLLVKTDPANPSNRRISIVLLRSAKLPPRAEQEVAPPPPPASLPPRDVKTSSRATR